MKAVETEDILYIPQIAFGSGLTGEARSLGYLAITRNEVAFVPQYTYKFSKESIWDNKMKVETTEVLEFENLSFWDAVPTLIEHHKNQEAETLVARMADDIEGSVKIPLSDIMSFKVGLINLVLKTNKGVVKINVGVGKHIKELLKKHLERKVSGS